MHELLTLTRFVVAQHRRLILFLISVVVVGEVSALVTSAYLPTFGDGAPQIIALFNGLMPAGFAALLLFDYGHEKDLMSAESGCSEWMLRMPIPTWKIALVPIVLKTMWVSVLWILFIASVKYVSVSSGSPAGTAIVAACILFSAAATWMLAVSWRPFRSGWFRLGVLIVVGIALYLGLASIFISHSLDRPQWRSWAVAGSYLLTISLYVSGVWYALRSAALARTASRGLIPAQGKAFTDAARDDYGVRDHVTARRALVWHDLERTKGFIRYTLILFVIPATLIATFFVPLHAATVGMALFLFAYFGAIASCGISGTGQGGSRTLPPYLGGSPLSTATIAWTRLLVIIAIAGVMSLLVVFVFIGWAFWPENRMTWLTWASQCAESLGSSSGGVAIGIRYSLAIVIGSLVLFLGRVASFMWVSMAGRGWLDAVYGVCVTLLFLLPSGVFLRWFLQQTDWETTTQTMTGWLVWIPYLVGGLLVLKAISVSTATIALWRSRVTSHANVLRAIACWGLLTIGIAVAVFALIPDPRATFWLCLTGTVLAIPLARVLVLPMSLAYNRHR